MNLRAKPGVTLLEVAITSGILATGVAMLLPMVTQARSSARRLQCAAKLGEIAQANALYENKRGRFPPGRGFPDWAIHGQQRPTYTSYGTVNPSNPHEQTGFQSVHYWLLPPLGMQAAFDAINADKYTKRLSIQGAPFNPNTKGFVMVGDYFVCPDDSNTSPGGITENNYRYNFGGATPYGGAYAHSQQNDITSLDADGAPVAGNGAFTIGVGLPVSAFRRGLGKTVFFSERTKGSGGFSGSQPPTMSDVINIGDRGPGPLGVDVSFDACLRTEPVASAFNFSGFGRWVPGDDWSNGWPFAGYDATEYNHLAPPNWDHVDCGTYSSIPDTPGEHAVITARSEHGAFVHAAYGDAHVTPISNDIDLEVWRALGRRDAPGKPLPATELGGP